MGKKGKLIKKLITSGIKRTLFHGSVVYLGAQEIEGVSIFELR
jgi:hypothetical protein